MKQAYRLAMVVQHGIQCEENLSAKIYGRLINHWLLAHEDYLQ